MRERGQCLGFPHEPAQCLRILRKVFGQDLDGDIALQPGIPRTVHLPHPTRAKGREDFIRSQAGSGSKCHGGVVSVNCN